MLAILSIAPTSAGPISDAGAVKLDNIPGGKFKFDGILGQRVKADIENWLLVTPTKNPGLLGMFIVRESNFEHWDGNVSNNLNMVPWAGEFVGKYLISSVQALRMSDDPRLRETVSKVVDRVIQLQTEDGYLGPWPKKEQLLGHWDLWGSYHVMLGLVLWHEQTGDEKAMAAARKAADLVCNTFLGTQRRVLDAKECDKNMAILHALAILYRKTGEPRYLAMAKEVIKDFERSGDWYRQGLSGTEFFRTPLPRWESLHTLQGLAELYRITGDDTFRRSFLHHWGSMRRFDLRNTGGFSSGEQATGNPFTLAAIETCCTIAWQCVMLDALRLTADSTIADDLEAAMFNAVAGAQHPTGEWFTYDTPINGGRAPSHVQIAFQARPNTPFLNCCSVNGPRGLGIVSEWGVMRSADGLAINYYGPMHAEVTLNDGSRVVIEEKTDYPIGDTIRLNVSQTVAKPFTLALRIPAWSTKTEVLLNGQPQAGVKPGEYLKLTRAWQATDEITVRLDMSLRYESGDLEQVGNVSLYRGPILLCCEDRFKSPNAGKIDVKQLNGARLVPIDDVIAKACGAFRPWLVFDVPTDNGKTMRLIDFANAGATGGSYRSWIPAKGIRPPRPVASQPLDGTAVAPSEIGFAWRNSVASDAATIRYTVVIADSPGFENPVLRYSGQGGSALRVPATEIAKLHVGTDHYWKVIAENQFGQSESIGPYKHFRLDAAAQPAAILPRNDGLVIAAPLRGDVKPDYGRLLESRGWKAATGPGGRANDAVELDGKKGMLKYQLPLPLGSEFTVSAWVSVKEMPKGRLGQVLSMWCRFMDDPLRIVVQDGKLFARIEAGQTGVETKGLPIALNQWRHIAVVRANNKLTLYINGKEQEVATLPQMSLSDAKSVALGGNPNFTDADEFLAVRVADFQFHARARSAEELKNVSKMTIGQSQTIH